MLSNTYFLLMRFNNLTGIWLLLFPALSGVLLATESLSLQTFFYLIVFTVGAFLMRPAGCIINDIFDKNIDAYVERTRNRPLACGFLNIKQALIPLFLLLCGAFIILLLTNGVTLLLGIISMFMIIVYPLLKRYIWFPQVFLGFTFNMGVLIGGTAVKEHFSLEFIIFYIGCIFWTLAYDTIYAHQDKKDDAKIGLKSTALYFGNSTKSWLKRFYLISLMMWLCSGILASLNNVFYISFLIVGYIFYYQHKKLDYNDRNQCMSAFKNHSYVGLIIFLGILFDRILKSIMSFNSL
ncbi:4-hydroxybenzoate octaprenyltransferase [Wolbachia endosymbiont of Pentidionis agamae]|uniref:4-hydroxybenzoate octaprenyltransferase n=1 Tax=Wolbachia endosymbiont of Pentidionis agamae TaxID=3110435 RepID=UPI002FD4083D